MSARLNTLIAWPHIDLKEQECAVVVTCRAAQADFVMSPQHARTLAAELLAAADFVTSTLKQKGLNHEAEQNQIVD
jgi:hypothetical protein